MMSMVYACIFILYRIYSYVYSHIIYWKEEEVTKKMRSLNSNRGEKVRNMVCENKKKGREYVQCTILIVW